MLQQEKLKWLKEKIGQKVKLRIRTEWTDEDLGNMNPLGNAQTNDEEILIIFLGVYGVDGQLLYIYGKDPVTGKDKLFRNSLNIWVNEDTGNPTHEDRTTLQKLNDVDIEGWFSKTIYLDGESRLEERIKAVEPGEKYLAERIVRGEPDYWPVGSSPHYSPSYSIFDEPKFINKVLTYLERII